MTFAMGAYGSPVTTTELKSSIDLWKRRTQILRNQIGPSAGSKDGPKKLTRRSFREQFDLNKLKKPLSYNEPLVFLKFILDAAVAAADVTLKEISSSKYAGARETEMWSVWVALLILALQRHGIPILRTYSSGKHRIEPAFIDVAINGNLFVRLSARLLDTAVTSIARLPAGDDYPLGDCKTRALIGAVFLSKKKLRPGKWVR